MRTFLIASVFLLFAGHTAIAQFKTRELKKTIELKMPKTAEDEMPGKRGASVVWHPIQKKYYAAFSGNIGFPLAVFDASGKRLSSEDQTAMADVRGLWYNPASKNIEGNGYGEFGWFHYTLDKKGMVDELEVEFEGMHQPDEQSVGAFNAAAKKVLFLNSHAVSVYNRNGEDAETPVMLHWGRTKNQGIDREAGDEEDDELLDDYNSTSLIFTGIPGSEIGVLNTYNRQVELYNQKSGFLTQKLKLPEGTPAESIFNFAFANGTYWFFDMDKRVWFGCK